MSSFTIQKQLTLSKPDHSSAGRIDPHIVNLCQTINNLPHFYTLSSCSGRSYIYTGVGTKKASTTDPFRRYRVNHELINDPDQYFDKNLTTNQYIPNQWDEPRSGNDTFQQIDKTISNINSNPDNNNDNDAHDNSVWLRYEPMILHVACANPHAANALVKASKKMFKNTAITNDNTNTSKKVVVAIWGDESLDMPIVDNVSRELFPSSSSRHWLKQIVNKKHERNWAKMDRLQLAIDGDIDSAEHAYAYAYESTTTSPTTSPNLTPKHFDVVGDVIIMHPSPDSNRTEQELISAAEHLLKINKRCRICCVQSASFSGSERQQNLRILAGDVRSPIITTHSESGIKAIVNLEATFFSTRMVSERTRLMNSVARGESVLVLFAGVGLEGFLIAGKTEASKVTLVEMNSAAVSCAKRGLLLLERNKGANEKASEKVSILEGDARDILRDLASRGELFDRVIAPRPKNIGEEVDG